MKGTRRDFFGQSAKILATGIIGSTVLNKIGRAEVLEGNNTPTSQPALLHPGVDYRTLGRTGLKISTVSLGSMHTTENVVRYAMDQGINFIHTADHYGKPIFEIGKAFKGNKLKNKVYLGLKVTWNYGKPGNDVLLDKFLKILNREYIDIMFFNFHKGRVVDKPQQVSDPEIKTAFERWKKHGKVRFMGLTTHGGMKERMELALQTGWYDCLMPAYDLSMRDSYLDIFKKCEKEKVGLIAMKTKVPEDDTASIGVLLKDKALTTVCKTMSSLSAVKKYLEAARVKVTDADEQRVRTLAGKISTGRCAMCGACTGACQGGLAVNDIVRSVDYYVDTMKDYESGQMNYNFIEAQGNADHCLDCGRCEKICPNRVPVRSFIKRAKEIFV
jgi:uncharacterized protein